LRIVLAIARQQLAGAFGHPLAYVVLAVFIGWVAITTLWVDDVLLAGVSSMRRPMFWMAAGLTLLAPALTMGLLAEDRRSGALQVVGTWPVTSTELVLGKWLGACMLCGVALALTFGWPLALSTLGTLDPGPVGAGYLALLLLCAASTAVGTATSAWTRHQVLAFLLAFSALLCPWLLGLSLHLWPTDLAPWVELCSLQFHLDRLVRGVVDSRSLVLFATVTGVCLRLAVLGLEHERLT
jgi:ABC-2 type transport system permease protein